MATTEMVKRKYRLGRIKAGDYLLLDNENRDLWRVCRYQEDGSLDTSTGPIVGEFWQVRKYVGRLERDERGLLTGEGAVDTDDWSLWDFYEGLFDTREDAIQQVLRDASRQS